MAYLIGEVTKELLETVHEFCEKEVRDLCRECDRSGEVPLGLFRQAMELQFHMLDIPECYGGLGLDKISAGALLEEMAKADAGFAVTFAASSLGLKPILFAGSEELKNEYLNPMRMITSTVAVLNRDEKRLAVISRGEVPKAKLTECLEEIYRTAVKAPISCGDIVLKDVCHTGVDIVSTATLE